jgi:hypothetical protein
MYAYRSFYQRDWTGDPLGTMYVIDFERLISFRAAEYGFHFTAKNGGSTTHRFNTCWSNASDSLGTWGGRAFYVDGVNEVIFINSAADFTNNLAVLITNGAHVQFLNFAIESCRVNTANNHMMQIGTTRCTVAGLKEVACTVDIAAGSAGVLFPNATTAMTITGYTRQALTTTSGTLYKATLNSAGSRVSIMDDSILQSEANPSGFQSGMFAFRGVRTATNGTIPNQGTNYVGEYVRNGIPAVGQPKGWYCTVAGTSGTWVSEGNL